MSEPTATSPTAPTTLKRHPIRGALWGLALGLGAALLLIGRKVIAFGTLPPLIVIVLGIAAGVLWAMFGPARPPQGPPPGQGAPTG
jgi:hypothetical protein